ncbi:MAG: 2-C-methyl-D-erythritol 4-phosphate cytidylyltransferase, partial [Candidatus Dormibacteria bacterium]
MTRAGISPLVSAVVPAAGNGTRFGGAKLWADLGGQPVLAWVLRALGDPASGISELVVVADVQDHHRVVELSADVAPRLGCRCVAGGSRRQESVLNGLRACSGDMVLIHDGARPGVSAELLARVLVAAGRVGAATAYIPVTDSIARIADDRVDETLARDQMGAIQTPQAFARQLLVTAHERALAEGLEADDDAALVMAMGAPVAAVLGDYRNLKLTRADDMTALRSWLVT